MDYSRLIANKTEKELYWDTWHVYYFSNTSEQGVELFKDAEDIKKFRWDLDCQLGFQCCTELACYLTKTQFHLIIRQDLRYPSLEPVKSTSFRYARYYNKKYNRTGSLYSGKMHVERVTSGWQAARIYQEHLPEGNPEMRFVRALLVNDIYAHIEKIRKFCSWDEAAKGLTYADVAKGQKKSAQNAKSL